MIAFKRIAKFRYGDPARFPGRCKTIGKEFITLLYAVFPVCGYVFSTVKTLKVSFDRIGCGTVIGLKDPEALLGMENGKALKARMKKIRGRCAGSCTSAF